MTYSGSITLPAGFKPSGQLVYIDVGGVIKHFALDAAGVNKVGGDSAKLLAPRGNKNLTGASTVTLQFAFKSGSFAALLTDEGLTNTTVIAKQVTVPVLIFVDGILYEASVSQSYTAKAGGTGKSK
jgi:hypothetical protein